MSCCGKGEKSEDALEKILSSFHLNSNDILDVSKRMDAAMTRGQTLVQDYDVRMFPTFINSVPSGREKGKFLSLDLGAMRLVISLVELRGKQVSFRKEESLSAVEKPLTLQLPSNMQWSSHGMNQKKNAIGYESLGIDLPEEIKIASGDALFQYLVDRLKDFLAHSTRIPQGAISLGFSFPCPCRNIGSGRGILTNWTKGFHCEGVLGQDVVQLLQQALDKNDLGRIRVEVLLNDTLATLLAGSYGPSTASVLVGVMLGTASNAVFQQRLDQVPVTNYYADYLEHWQRSQDTMIIDTQWGAFGESTGDLDNLRTEFDLEVDNESNNPGGDVLTKMMCGMYTGEIVRLILAKLYELQYFLPKQDAPPLLRKEGRWKINHMHMSLIETDRGITFSSTKKAFQELGMNGLDTSNCRIIKRVSEAVTARSASLAGAALAAIIRRVPRETVTVAIDGSLLRYHPTYQKRLEGSIDRVLKMYPSNLVPRQIFSLRLITDGAIIGAAIAAACNSRDRSTI